MKIEISLTHNVEVGAKKYVLSPTNEAKEVELLGAGMFQEKDKPDDILVIVSVTEEDGKVQTGAVPAEELFDTIEEAEAEMVKRKAQNEEDQLKSLIDLYKKVVIREKEIEDTFTEKGIDVKALKEEALTPAPETAEETPSQEQ